MKHSALEKDMATQTMNRRGNRMRTDAVGSIKLGLFKRLRCEIRDVSPGGARIVVAEGTKLPAEFVMNFPQFRHPRTCVKRWESGLEVGVEFKVG